MYEVILQLFKIKEKSLRYDTFETKRKKEIPLVTWFYDNQGTEGTNS